MAYRDVGVILDFWRVVVKVENAVVPTKLGNLLIRESVFHVHCDVVPLCNHGGDGFRLGWGALLGSEYNPCCTEQGAKNQSDILQDFSPSFGGGNALEPVGFEVFDDLRIR